ncbi:unnamed protein product, partial [marine sediment metagenome]
MPKNTGRGGKKFRGSKKTKNMDGSRPMDWKEDGQEYAKVIKMLGNMRLTALTNCGNTILCIIPGKFKSREWINQDDIILITVRDHIH